LSFSEQNLGPEAISISVVAVQLQALQVNTVTAQ
jgi:hypothetical protein